MTKPIPHQPLPRRIKIGMAGTVVGGLGMIAVGAWYMVDGNLGWRGIIALVFGIVVVLSVPWDIWRRRRHP
jgi:hypothetical protein